MAIWLATLGGMLLGEALIVMSLYWHETGTRRHVIAVSASYLILVGLSLQPALRAPLTMTAHIVLAIIAYVLGAWSLWRLVPDQKHERGRDADDT